MKQIPKYLFGNILDFLKSWGKKGVGLIDMIVPSPSTPTTSGAFMPAVSTRPVYSERRGRKKYLMHSTGRTCSSPECAKYVNEYFNKNGGGSAWSHNYTRPYINGYEGIKFQDRNGSTYLNHLSYNLDAADNLLKNFNINKLDPKQSYVVNMYYTGSPWDYKSRNGNSYSQGTHTGVLVNNGKRWVIRHNFHGLEMEDPLEDLLGTNYNMGITSISIPYKKRGGLLSKKSIVQLFKRKHSNSQIKVLS